MTAPFALAWHITKKDLRPLRWLIALFVTLTVLQALLRVAWPPMMVEMMLAMQPQQALDTARWVESARLLLPSVRGLLFAEIVLLLVQADPLVTTDAFWLTRPIAPRVLFCSKLLTTALVLLVPTCLTQVVLMFALDVPLIEIVRVVPDILLYTTAPMTAVLIGAALTANQRELLAWIVGLVALVVAGTLVFDVRSSGQPAKPPVMTRALESSGLARLDARLTGEVLFAASFIGAAWHLYRTRRRGRAALMAAASAGASLFVTVHMPPYEVLAEPRQIPLASAFPLEPAMRYHDGPRNLTVYPIEEDKEGNCRAMARTTKVQGLRSFRDQPGLTYGFVHRPTGLHLAHNTEHFDNWSYDLAPTRQMPGNDALEAFEIDDAFVWIYAPKRSGGWEPPLIKSVSCRDVDVRVERRIFAPES